MSSRNTVSCLIQVFTSVYWTVEIVRLWVRHSVAEQRTMDAWEPKVSRPSAESTHICEKLTVHILAVKVLQTFIHFISCNHRIYSGWTRLLVYAEEGHFHAHPTNFWSSWASRESMPKTIAQNRNPTWKILRVGSVGSVRTSDFRRQVQFCSVGIWHAIA